MPSCDVSDASSRSLPRRLTLSRRCVKHRPATSDVANELKEANSMNQKQQKIVWSRPELHELSVDEETRNYIVGNSSDGPDFVDS